VKPAFVIPAEAGIHAFLIPVFAGMTEEKSVEMLQGRYVQRAVFLLMFAGWL